MILHRLKYGGQKEIGAIMGRYMAAELLSSNFFQGIDVIIPIPLHKKKQQILVIIRVSGLLVVLLL